MPTGTAKLIKTKLPLTLQVQQIHMLKRRKNDNSHTSGLPLLLKPYFLEKTRRIHVKIITTITRAI